MTRESERELEYEFEGEFEDEPEGEFEDEGELEDELELEGELEDEYEGEWEGEDEGEEFLGSWIKKAARGVKGFVKKAAPILKRVAKVAAPIVGGAIGGPAGAMLAKTATGLLGESEFEEEWESEGEFEDEFEGEGEAEAEYMADAAAKTKSPSKARALAGAAAVASLAASDRAALRQILPHMVRGTDILTRILRSKKITRPAVRVIPTIVKRTAKTLKHQSMTGKPITRKAAGRAMAIQVRRVLGSPKTCAAAMTRNLAGKKKLARRRPLIRG